MSQLPGKINVLSELERVGRKYNFTGTDRVKVLCPFHDDHTPSCDVDTETGDFKCFVCSRHGDLFSLIAKIVDRPRSIIFIEMSQRYDIGSEPSVDPLIVEQWHRRIWNAPPLLKALYDRGLTDDMIREHRLGESSGRVTIPIKNAHGRIVNVQSYLPGAAPGEKMRSMKGRGKTPRLYPVDQLRFDMIAVCGGPIKAVGAAGQLNKRGIGAVSTVGGASGEKAWHESFTEALSNKQRVWVVNDVDETGRRGAQMICRLLYPRVPWVSDVLLPLDTIRYPKGDVSDFIGLEHGDLYEVLRASPQWVPAVQPRVRPDGGEEPEDVDLNQAYSAERTEKRVRLEAVAAAVATDKTYTVPKEVRVRCDRSQDCCPRCPAFVAKSDEYPISREDRVILEFVGESKRSQRASLMDAIGVPPECQVVQFEVGTYQQVDEVRLSPRLEILSTSDERALMSALVVKDGLQLNEHYRLTGRQYPHPRDQSATLLIGDYEPVGDALSHYDPGTGEELRLFQPRSWDDDAVREKLDELYLDLEANVTRIVQRQRIARVMDLAWHSPLFMTFDGRVEKAWADVLVIGDSSQGKSETAKRLLEHYGVGTCVVCKGATTAGLVGGLQQLAGRWFVSWGVVPTNDKRLVVLEEAKGASETTIGAMTDMRSSGVAELPKIEKRRTRARTRLVWISNPRSGQPMSSYAFGVEAVRELMGAAEDVRRFDAVVGVSSDEIDRDVVNKLRDHRPTVEHRHTRELCRSLVLWAWTRTPEQVTLDEPSTRCCLEAATELCERYSEDVPIVDGASMRLKIARLSAALACRTFSSDDGASLRVRPCHVRIVRDLLVECYDARPLGYGDFSRSARTKRVLLDTEVVHKTIKNAPHARSFAENLLDSSRFDHQDVQDWCGYDRQEANKLIGLLTRKRAVMRDGRFYVKTPQFIDLLKRALANGLAETPKHLEEGNF